MTTLERRLGLGALVLYGIGDILGAGIYALIGKVVGIAGPSAWLCFGLSALLAGVTGLSYAELTSRIPKSAGAAAFCGAAFRHPLVPYLVGILVLASGITSTAAVSLAFYGYLKVFVDIPPLAAALGLIALISLLNYRGIRESAAANNLMTAVEVSGLLLVIGAGLAYASRQEPAQLVAAIAPSSDWAVVLPGAALAFYAFIGFEDLANLAEEAKDPARDIPRAILAAVGVTSVLYLLVAFIVLWAMSPAAAGASMTPLLDVLKVAGFPLPPWAFAPVALVAVCNTGLANLVMASRLLYGMAGQGLLPRGLAAVHPVRRTPWVSVIVAMVLCMALVLSGGVTVMAQTTSLLLMLVFFMVHLSLLRLRRLEGGAPAGGLRVPAFVPYAGLAVSAAMALRADPRAWGRAGLVAAAGTALFFLSRRGLPNVDPAVVEAVEA